MDINTTFMFFDKFRNDNMSLLYSGNFSDDTTTNFIDLSDYNIESHLELSKMKRKVSFLMAECFQNIVRHGESVDIIKRDTTNPGFFLTRNIEKSYFISSGNLIAKRDIDNLEGILNQVNSLNKDELKDLYRKVLTNDKFSSKGGAGLGMIDIARRSGQKIEFSFKDYDNNFSLFYNQISLNKPGEETDLSGETVYTLEDSIELHKMMDNNHILLIQKGDFSQSSILPILDIIEQNFQRDKELSNLNKSVYHILVELLQNIGKHSLKIKEQHEGIFLIGRKKSEFVVMAGNFVESSKVSDFKRRLKIIQSLTKDELKKMYLKELTDGEGTKKSGAGIGLIDISRESSKPIKYVFHEIDQNKVFFSIKITV